MNLDTIKGGTAPPKKRCLPRPEYRWHFLIIKSEGVMKSRTKRTERDYSLAFKLSVVDQVEAGELTYKQAQKRYSIQVRSTVLVWFLCNSAFKIWRLESIGWNVKSRFLRTVLRWLLESTAVSYRGSVAPSIISQQAKRLDCSTMRISDKINSRVNIMVLSIRWNVPFLSW